MYKLNAAAPVALSMLCFSVRVWIWHVHVHAIYMHVAIMAFVLYYAYMHVSVFMDLAMSVVPYFLAHGVLASRRVYTS